MVWNVLWMEKWLASFWVLPCCSIMAAPSRSTTLPLRPNTNDKASPAVCLEQCLTDLKSQGIVGFHLITAREGVLPAFYERFGFKKEERVMLMGKE